MTPTTKIHVPTGVLLVVAIAGEVAGTASLRLSEGLSRPFFVLAVIACYGGSIAIMGRILGRGMAMGVAYGTLTGVGLIAATLLSLVAFDDALSGVQVAGLVVLAAGAALLQVDRT